MPNGQLDYISVQSSNLAAIKVRGIDAQADYRFSLPSALALADGTANLSLQATASWLFERSQQVLATLPAVDCAGLFGTGCTGTGSQGIPSFKLNLGATYDSGPLTFRLEGRMIGSFDLVPGQTWPVTHVGNYWYLDMTAKVRIFDKVEVFGA
ncbi:TonB-dependent receptor [Sphingomonas colocasiae]|uniref:TonB-dependent receptor n=1 Tax=Sphingomonas colocasiae TaxID=1848973 RepID=A0ABS7PPZ1_9SPHN|nr:TonB-dependent receptor [Sphingomonas colocasiae]MBY8826446.1 TonB-dependent receptor [Sphingomonas colocasiae]